MRKQKPAPLNWAQQWWRPARPPAAVVVMAACLMVGWATIAVDGAPKAHKRNIRGENLCHPLREVIWRNMKDFDDFYLPLISPRSRPNFCNDESIRELMMGHICEHNSTDHQLWERVCCPSKAGRGGSGLNQSPSATGTQPSIANNLSNLTRIARQARDRDRVTPSPNNKKLKKVTKLMRKVACKPNYVMVEVEKAPGEEHFIFQPCKFRVKRCTGCCNDEAMACQPTKTQNKTMTVLKLMHYDSHNNDNSLSLNDNLNFVRKTVVQHNRCECQCKVQRTDCTNDQEYEPSNCRCVCPQNAERRCRGNLKYFNRSTCTCECIGTRRLCSTGMVFNNHTCSCN